MSQQHLESNSVSYVCSCCCVAEEDQGKFAPIVGFECRGLEPIDWTPEVLTGRLHRIAFAPATNVCLHEQYATRSRLRTLQGGFVIESTRGKVFRDCDLSEKEWVDVDEDTGESVSIMELEWKFETRR